MAGGMGRPWSGQTLADRSGGPSLASNVGAAVDSVPEESSPTDRAALTPHCWVVDAPEHPGRYAGLLLEWRRDGRSWLGLVAFVLPEVTGNRVRLIQRWLPAGCLSPADRP
jgi:hypothetical protein